MVLLPNGDRYEGGFFEDVYEGEGTLTFTDGSVKQGFWNKNEFVDNNIY